MDIDLLSKMVKELVLDNDKVVLPELGCFVAEIVPSTFSDKGYTINPPYRRLSFRSTPIKGELLVSFYASSNKIEVDVARRIITDFINELKTVLFSRKMVVFPGLGRLRATKENNIFFVADENLDIYPAGFGLQSISMKTHSETKEELSAAVEDLASLLSESSPVSSAELFAGDVISEAENSTETDVQEKEDIVVQSESSDADRVEQVDRERTNEDFRNDEADIVSDVVRTDEVVGELADVSEKEVIEDVVEGEVRLNVGGECQDDIEKIVVEAEKPVVENIHIVDHVVENADSDSESQRKSYWRQMFMILSIIVVILVILLLLFIIIGRLAPDFIDKILYTTEELEILHYKL